MTSNNGVIILAATNRPESLDPALTRPGRFDRRVPVELPDLKGREAILKVHAKKIKIGGRRRLQHDRAHGLRRFRRGACQYRQRGRAARRARRAARSSREADLEESIEVVIAGYQKKNAILTDQEKRIVAYHEIGHALVAALQSHSAPVQKITIIPRTSGALGYTMQVEEGDQYLMTQRGTGEQDRYAHRRPRRRGGRASAPITTGASNDIEQATKLARAMITRYGMSDGFRHGRAGDGARTSTSAATRRSPAPPKRRRRSTRRSSRSSRRQHEKAVSILKDNRAKLDELAKYLYEKETITGEEFMKILNLEKAQDKTQD